MKKIVILTFLITSMSIYSQSPEKFSYQAVIRDTENFLVVNTNIGMQISILHQTISGNAVYVERHFPTTNDNGLISIEVGAGTIVSGDFSYIDWNDGPYFLKSETDLNGGASYTISGTIQLLSVPYSLHSKTAESITGSIVETDPVFLASVAAGITSSDTSNWNSKLDSEIDGDTTNELQVLTQNGLEVTLSQGGGIISISDGDTTFWKQNGDTIYYMQGRVGIGVASPKQALHVDGGIKCKWSGTATQTLQNGWNTIVHNRNIEGCYPLYFAINGHYDANQFKVEAAQLVNSNSFKVYLSNVTPVTGRINWIAFCH